MCFDNKTLLRNQCFDMGYMQKLGHCYTCNVDIVKHFIPNIKFLESNSADILLP